MAKNAKGLVKGSGFRECWSRDVPEFQVEHVLSSLWTSEIPESGYIPNCCCSCGSADAMNLEHQKL